MNATIAHSAATPPARRTAASPANVGLAIAFAIGLGAAAVGAAAQDAVPHPSLSLALSALAALLCAAAFGGMRRQGWAMLPAGGLLLLAAARPSFLYLLTGAPEFVPVIGCVIALILALRRMETHPDVQAQMNLGLVLGLMVVVAPYLALLALPMAGIGAFMDRGARHSLRIFLSLFFVLIAPALVLAIGRAILLAHSGLPANAGLPLAQGFGGAVVARPAFAVAYFLPLLPVALVPLVSLLRPGRGGHAVSALAVVLVPLHLELCRGVFGSAMASWIPGLALVTGVIAFVAVTPLSPRARAIALLAMLSATLFAWEGPRTFGSDAWETGVAQPFARVVDAVR